MEVFSKCSFGSEKLNHSEDSVKIGQEIAERCARNPLAIRVVGSFLFGQDESKWQSFLDIGLANFREIHDDITPIQLLSYHHLESPIKCCFSYCALFPKDFEIGKEMLISLWMAQGYIVPLDKGQSIEDADVKKNEDGEINSCKIHDLMHEITQKVTQGEISAKTVSIDDLDKKVRHLSFDRSSFANYSFNNTHIRSFLNVNDNFQFVNMEQLLPVKALVASCKCLRALDLSELNIKSLPSSMGNLLHLRLVNLRILDTWGCYNLTFMPRGVGKLTYLHTLSKFIVGGAGSGSSWEQWCDGMDDLRLLNLKNDLEIHIKWPLKGTNAVKQEGSGRSVLV
uniref:Disease resistance protein winged helix domain-containing protein n=1 Tax=Chenopodium quinoa TaxID=63459 RepID=A0A803MLP7_CHEQI